MFLGEGSDEMGSDGALEVLSEAAGECDPVAFTEALALFGFVLAFIISG